MKQAYRDMFLYCNSVMEPWDGPAALAATDGRWVIAGLDRNGLRPLRYTIARNALLIVGSEAGMVKLEESEIVEKGRVGPGQSIGVDLDTATFFTDEAMKDMLAARQPFGEWAKRIRQIDHIVKTDAPEPVFYDREELRRRQLAVGTTLEELEMILHPMVEDGQDAVGSMGDDTPLAVLSEKYRGLHHYFRQGFSQVTNPPIDSLRETRVMTLKTRLGNLGNVMDEDSSQFDLLQLESPVLSTAEFAAMRETMGASACVVDCTFAVADGKSGLRAALERIRREAEEGVRAGCTLQSHLNTIIRNTVLYGATAGSLYAAGQAGERFAVRNSGATAVVEGTRMGLLALFRISPVGWACGVSAGLANSTFHELSPVYLQSLRHGAAMVGMFAVAANVAGLVIQMPAGMLSDRIGRRPVALMALLGAGTAAVGFLLVGAAPILVLMVLGALLSGLAAPLYGLGAGLTNDRLDSGDAVAAAGALLLAWSAGATVGPFVGGLVMERVGPAGLFHYLVLVFAGMALFTAWRMMLRAEVPRERRTAFVPAASPPPRLPGAADD